jgi:nickel-dependent lactate racemase
METVLTEIHLPYPGKELRLSLGQNLMAEVISPSPVFCPKDPKALIKKALAQPTGSPSLEQLASSNSRVAIIVDDITRETPAHLAIPLILEALHDAGVNSSKICFVMALGTHRPMTPDEIEVKLGPQVADKYQVVNDPCTDLEKMVFMGQSPMGIPFWLHKAVAHADLRIGLGMICPHLDAGYGGGAKIILPGASAAKTISCFHQRMTQLIENQLGKPDALLRKDLEKTVQSLAPLSFILNLGA